MKNSWSHNFLLVSILWSLFSFNISAQTTQSVQEQKRFTTPIFDSTFKKGLFKGSLDISKHHLTGLFFLKRISDTAIRIAFSNEIGMSYFDLESKGDSLIIHSCFPSLHKKSLLHLIQNDIRYLVLPIGSIIKIKALQSKDSGLISYRIKSKKGSFIYSISKESGRICRIQTKRAIMGKTDIHLEYTANNIRKIIITNPTIGLQLHLTLLSN
ncbi:MAG: hypothetical protein ABSD71_01785 [Bacteroidales bacterium]|jgi:hypothetical protein